MRVKTDEMEEEEEEEEVEGQRDPDVSLCFATLR
jgi:hypothetical protein